jgi:hypothetical protein
MAGAASGAPHELPEEACGVWTDGAVTVAPAISLGTRYSRLGARGSGLGYRTFELLLEIVVRLNAERNHQRPVQIRNPGRRKTSDEVSEH